MVNNMPHNPTCSFFPCFVIIHNCKKDFDHITNYKMVLYTSTTPPRYEGASSMIYSITALDIISLQTTFF